MLRQTLSRPVCLGMKHPSRAYDQFYYHQTVAGLLIWGALSDERTGLSFTIAAGPRQRSYFWARVRWDLQPYFTVSDCLFIVSYDSQGYGGGILPRLHTVYCSLKNALCFITAWRTEERTPSRTVHLSVVTKMTPLLL
jgi:hypothetical protein